ncbi:MAG: hypothetical protein OSA99_01685 [Acidimicrobiales bacterium]|nr:hypothetical protein [Acidimicrobiales bacterium]
MRRIFAGFLASTAIFGGAMVSPSPAGSAPPEDYNAYVESESFQVSGTYQPLVGISSCGGAPESLFILWYAPGSANDYLWRLDDPSVDDHTSEPLPVNGVYEPIVGDFDGDGCDDIFWYAPGSARDYIWYGNAAGGFDSKSVTVNGTYRPVAANMSADDTDDVFWYAPGSGQEFIWDGHEDRTFTSHIGPTVNGDYLVATYYSTWMFHKPGPGQDYLWAGVVAGETAPAVNVAVDFDGSYIPLGGVSSIFLYGPGSAEDLAIVDVDEETFEPTTIPATINGTYVPGIRSPRASVVAFIWHAPGAATDHVWWGADS